jgi:O-antigen/teichoic acid export membrane protein
MLRISLTRFDTRDLRWLAAAGTFALGRGLNFAVLLITMPLVLSYLGPERFGIWLAANAVIAIFSILEGGVGNGLVVSVPRESGPTKRRNLSTQYSSAFFLLSSVGAAVIMVYLALAPFIDWVGILGAKGVSANKEMIWVIVVIGAAFALNFPVSFLRHFRVGLQEGAQAANWEMAASASSLLGIVLAVWLDSGLIGVAAGAAAPPPLVRCLHFLLYVRRRPEFRPALSRVRLPVVLALAKQGLPMWGIGISATTVTQINIWLIATRSTLVEASNYGVAQRYFMLAMVPAGIIWATLLPSLISALTGSDFAWAKRRFYRVAAFTTLGGWLLVGFMALAAPMLIRLWVGEAVTITATLIALMSLHSGLLLVQSAISTALLALGSLYDQAIMSGLYVLCSLACAWMVAPAYGAVGVAASTAATFAVCLVLPQIFLLRARASRHALH